ncbi:MAG: nucleotidyltransferase family protein [Fusobacteriaceae bacterium]
MQLEELISHKKEIEDICKKENIKKLSVFGSTVRGNSKIDSDVDMLVEFDGTQTLFQLIQTKYELEEKLKVAVDLVTKESLSKYFREDVLREAKVIYGV